MKQMALDSDRKHLYRTSEHIETVSRAWGKQSHGREVALGDQFTKINRQNKDGQM